MPACLVQRPIPGCSPKSIGEGASSLFGGRPESLENLSCTGQPQGCTGANLGLLYSKRHTIRDILETLEPSSEKTTCSFFNRFRATSRNRALYQALRVATMDSLAILFFQDAEKGGVWEGRVATPKPKPSKLSSSQPVL